MRTFRLPLSEKTPETKILTKSLECVVTALSDIRRWTLVGTPGRRDAVTKLVTAFTTQSQQTFIDCIG